MSITNHHINESSWHNKVVLYTVYSTSNFEDVHVRKLQLDGARKEAEARTRPVEVTPNARATRVLSALHELNYCLEERVKTTAFANVFDDCYLSNW